MRRIFLFFLLLFAGNTLFAQQYTEAQLRADSLTRRAIKAMDGGKTEAALELLALARKADPEAFFPVYETGYLYYAQKDYKTALKTLEPVLEEEGVDDQAYQLVGNSWDLLGKPKKALAAYNAGLKKFPKSGKLYLEIGNIYTNAKDYTAALESYEKGIEKDPGFSSNYYHTAFLYAGSSEKIWGALYAELFMNLERSTSRTVETGKTLFGIYKDAVEIINDTAAAVYFSKTANVMYDSEAKPKLPFASVYEINFLLSLAGDTVWNLPAMVKARMKFTDLYFANDMHDTYPNVLFNYQGEIKEAGHLEAYNYWLLGDGDEPAFKVWLKDHKQEYAAFADWYNAHPLELNEFNSFRSGKP